VQYLKALGAQRRRSDAYTSDITARSIKAGDKTVVHWVLATADEDNRNFGGCGFGCLCRSTATSSDYHRDLTANQVGRHSRQSVVLSFCPAVFDCYVLPLDKASFAQSPLKRSDFAGGFIGRAAAEIPDYRHPLLRPRPNRPRDGCTSEKRDEFAPPHIRSEAQETGLYRLKRVLR
jgi:hypothetical protein